MNSIRIETHIDSETLFLPQLRPLLGKDVEIVVHERTAAVIRPPVEEWAAVQAAVLGLEDYDADAYRRIRESELQSRNGDST